MTQLHWNENIDISSQMCKDIMHLTTAELGCWLFGIIILKIYQFLYHLQGDHGVSSPDVRPVRRERVGGATQLSPRPLPGCRREVHQARRLHAFLCRWVNPPWLFSVVSSVVLHRWCLPQAAGFVSGRVWPGWSSSSSSAPSCSASASLLHPGCPWRTWT